MRSSPVWFAKAVAARGVTGIIFVLAGAFLPPAALGGIPSVSNSTLPASITLGDARNPSACQLMVLRSANNNELAGCPVTLDFSACGSDIRVCVVQPDQPARFSAGQPATVVCGGRTVSVDANAIGEVCLSLSGGTSLPYGHGPAPADRPGCCAIYALTKPMGTAIVTIVSYDLNGDRSVNAGDLSRWLAYAGGAYGGYRSKVDYNADGALNAGDLSLWLSCAGLGLAPASIGCDGFCP